MLRRSMLIIAILALAAVPGGAQTDGWRQLFNGKDMTGWEQVGPGRFVIEDGLLKTEGGMGLLWYTPNKISNSVIRVVFKVTNDNDNSGVFIRIPIPPREEKMPVNYGEEAQIYGAGDEYHCTGVLYSLTKALARPAKPSGEWNTMEITLDGPHTIVVLNGVKVTDYTEGQPVPERVKDYEPQRGRRPDAGYIGVQNHPREDKTDSGVYFKEVAVKPLGK
jgi:hypothetical protein